MVLHWMFLSQTANRRICHKILVAVEYCLDRPFLRGHWDKCLFHWPRWNVGVRWRAAHSVKESSSFISVPYKDNVLAPSRLELDIRTHLLCSEQCRPTSSHHHHFCVGSGCFHHQVGFPVFSVSLFCGYLGFSTDFEQFLPLQEVKRNTTCST